MHPPAKRTRRIALAAGLAVFAVSAYGLSRRTLPAPAGRRRAGPADRRSASPRSSMRRIASARSSEMRFRAMRARRCCSLSCLANFAESFILAYSHPPRRGPVRDDGAQPV